MRRNLGDDVLGRKLAKPLDRENAVDIALGVTVIVVVVADDEEIRGRILVDRIEAQVSCAPAD
jgi:hypothetical protein